MDSGYGGHSIIFLVGAPRSGTTYLQRLLASHSQISTGQESHLFPYIASLLRLWNGQIETGRPQDRGGVGLPCYFTETEFNLAVKDFLVRLLAPMVGNLGPGEYFLEKTPLHALLIPEILQFLPRAKFIHLLRDGRDVAASLLAASRSWGRAWAPSDPLKAARLWKSYVEAVERATPTIPPGQYHEVRYERLRAAPLQVLAQLAQFIGVEWETEPMTAAVQMNAMDVVKSGEGTPIPKGGEFGSRTGQVVREPEGFVRRGEPGGWQRDLSMIERAKVWLVASQTLRRVGYPWGPSYLESPAHRVMGMLLSTRRRAKQVLTK